MNKKLQVFVSSTYTDLIEERQAAVEAILDAGHIPAGMELFKAGKSQMKTIRKWIDESDVYVLILGGRYGSIEEESGLSYTELEYNYAFSKNMPVFAIVLDDSFLFAKASSRGKDTVFEKKNKTKYNKFKTYIIEKDIVKFINKIEEISTVIHSQLNYIQAENADELCGWVKYTDNKNNYDDKNSLSILTKSYNNLSDKYNVLLQQHNNLLNEYKNQMYKLANLQIVNDKFFSDFRKYDETFSTSYNADEYRCLEKLLQYSKISMYKYRFKEIKLEYNFYTLKSKVTYTLEDFFILIYHLSYCNIPVNTNILDGCNNDRNVF